MIYLHVPFCRSFCTYCDFYSEVASRCVSDEQKKFGIYADALCREVRERRDEFNDDVNTLYIGGGTPSVLPLSVFARLVEALREVGLDCDFEEFTVEVNPEDIVEKGEAYVEGLLKLGVNRISMGVQSFDDGILQWMNRRHDAAASRRAYGILENAGVDNISIDLIFGLPQFPDAGWRGSLSQALDISGKGVLPKHVSAYQLSVEPGSALASLVAKGVWEEAADDLCSRQYDILCSELKAAGYNHYEISNFAQPGYEAVHNSAYWSHVPYVGLGPGAHSFLKTDISGNPVHMRKWNKPDIASYLAAASSGDFSQVVEHEVLTSEQLALEHVMLGLRTSSGLPESFLMEHCEPSAVSEALSSGNLERCPGGMIHIPESRFFISDAVISAL